MTQTCSTCQKPFDPANRASPGANEGAAVQIVYCSDACARKAENKRYYEAHKEQIIKKAIKRRKEKK